MFIILLDWVFSWLLSRLKPQWPARPCEIAPELVLSKMSEQNGSNSVWFGGLMGANRVREIKPKIAKVSE